MRFTFLLFTVFAINAQAYVDLSLSYTHSVRKVEGVETDANPEPGSAQTISNGYTLNWAWYIWEYTALELNYASTTEQLIDDREAVSSDGSLTIKKIDSTVITQVNGVGIRQAFASRKATIIPSIAIGYAQYTTSGATKYTVDDNGTEEEIEVEKDKEVFSSSYAAFSLRFRFTELMGLTLGAKTIMPDFDTDQASNNVTYSAGFSWVF